LDEELIGIFPAEKKKELLETIRPQYIILKPGLLGGFSSSDEWITLAEKLNIGWWATSALESNIGLNAIAQWVLTKNVSIPQGLGTGLLFSNNIDSPLTLHGEKLFYDETKIWGKSLP
jgi:O-succinylbenzoate synthase